MVACAGCVYSSVEPENINVVIGEAICVGKRASTGPSVIRKFVNATSRDYHVACKDQVRLILPKPPIEQRAGRLYVDVIYRMTLKEARLMNTHFKFNNPTPSALLEQIKRAVYHISSGGDWDENRAVTFTICYTYLDSKICESESKAVYLPEHDVLLQAVEHHTRIMVYHPGEQVKSDQEALLSGIQNASMKSLVLAIRIIDNGEHKNISDRYIHLGGAVHHIAVEKDPRYKDGVHLTAKYPANHVLEGGVEQRHLTIEEADALLGLARTAEDAKLGGNSSDLMKKQLERELQELKLEELDKRRVLLELDNELKLEQAKVSRLEAEAKRLDIQQKRLIAEEANVKAMQQALARDFKEIVAVVLAAFSLLKAVTLMIR